MLLSIAALLVATPVVTAAPVAPSPPPPVVDAVTGRNLTLDTDLRQPSGISAWAIDAFLAANTPLPPLGAAFKAAEARFHVNALYLLAHAMHEFGFGRSYLARYKNNLFGWNAADRNPGRLATSFGSYTAAINVVAAGISQRYLNPGGVHYGGAPTLRGMHAYASDPSWGPSIVSIARSMYLPTLRGRGVTFTTHLATETLTTGDSTTLTISASPRTALPDGLHLVARVRQTSTGVAVAQTTGATDATDGEAINAADAAPETADAAGAAPDATAPASKAEADGAATGAGAATASDGPDATATGAGSAADRDQSTDAAAAPPDPVVAPAAFVPVSARSRNGSFNVPVDVGPNPGTFSVEFEIHDSNGDPLTGSDAVPVPPTILVVQPAYDVAFSAAFTAGVTIHVANVGETTVPAAGPAAGTLDAGRPTSVLATWLVRAGQVAIGLPRQALPADLVPGATWDAHVDLGALTLQPGDVLIGRIEVPDSSGVAQATVAGMLAVAAAPVIQGRDSARAGVGVEAIAFEPLAGDDRVGLRSVALIAPPPAIGAAAVGAAAAVVAARLAAVDSAAP